MSKQQVILILYLIFAAWSCQSPKITVPPPHNVLWLIIEDFSPDLGCYGNTQLKTPNIDQLAASGTLFTNVFTTAPVCSASRSAFMTGMYQTSIGAHHHRSHREDDYQLPDTIQTAPEWFSKYGFYTANVKHGFKGFKGSGKTDLNFSHKKIFDGDHWDSLKQNQPFYAQVNFKPVHRILYKMPDTLLVDPAAVQLPPYYPDHAVARLDWAQYLTKAMLLDNMVGEVLDKLEVDGLAENTIVMLFSDHGRNHVRGKQWLYDPGVHIPLIIKNPVQVLPRYNHDLVSAIDILPTSLKLAGINISNEFQGQDLLDTLKSSREYVFAARDRCDETEERLRSVRNKQFKYIKNFRPELPYMQSNKYKQAYYPMWTLIQNLKLKGKLNDEQLIFTLDIKPEEELYDLNKDPYEINNLAERADYQDILLQMRIVLGDWVSSTNDQGVYPEVTKSLNYWKTKSKNWNVTNQINVQKRLIESYE